jgi:4-hydroxybenzoate polyprenyltransferase
MKPFQLSNRLEGSASRTSMTQFIRPYMELMRLHKPVGVLAIFFPYLYGYLYALQVSPGFLSPWEIVGRLLLLVFSTFILRSLGCAWNDIADAELDAQVERTRSRPMARGAISYPAAYTFNAGLYALWLMTLGPLLPNRHAFGVYITPLTVLVMAYPYMKRITHFAQVELGITLGWGVLIGASAGGVDILAITSQKTPKSAALGLWLLYATYLVWTVIYDVVYAFQDVRDDIKAGAMSMAVLLQHRPKQILSVLSMIQIGLLLWVGLTLAGVAVAYHLFAVGLAGMALVTMIQQVDLDDPKSCGKWFKRGTIWIDFAIAAGLTFNLVLH